MEKKYVMAFDAGTTGCRSIIFDRAGAQVSTVYQEFSQIYPFPGWVEHDPQEIWNAQHSTAQRAINQAGIDPEEIAGIGITNQRETTVVWEKGSGLPVMNAIVWQDRRTAPFCEELTKRGLGEYVSENTGVIIDAYFSGTKIRWILDNIPGARERAEKGEFLFGTIDSWLIWNLTGGKAHVIDYSNASRTMLFNIKTLQWDEKLLREVGVPRAMLPEALPSSHVYGETDGCHFSGVRIPVAGAIGDQQGALFGQACFDAGKVKATYGTGCMEGDAGIKNTELKVDGGACRNNFLLQFQADLLGIPVLRPKVVETTARGAAFLAGLATGFWTSKDEIADSFELDRRFDPQADPAVVAKLYEGWKEAIGRVLTK